MDHNAGRREISALNERQPTDYRRHDVGFVFQFYNSCKTLPRWKTSSWLEICKNPTMLEALNGRPVGPMFNFPAQLSGGEQQRVAIARALAKNPKLLLCDEPTGALDFNTGRSILKLLQDSCRKTGKTVIVITHNQAITQIADRVIHIRSGRVSDILENPNPLPVERIEW